MLFYTPTVTALLRPGVTAPTGGAETQIFLLSQMLARQGLRVGLVAQDIPEGLPDHVAGVTIVKRPPYRAHSRLVGKVREAVLIWQVLHRANASVIVKRMYGIDAGLVGIYARAARRRYVYSSANVVDFTSEKLLTKSRDRFLFHLGIRLANEIVVQTEEQLPMCQSRFGRSARLIKSIAEEAEPAGGAPQSFLWIGRVVSYKQPMAFLELARALPHVRFSMVGVPHAGDEREYRLYEDVLAAASTLTNVELLEPRPRSELVPLVNDAVAIVNTADFEGMPNVLLEGWSRGIPALVLHHDPGGVIEKHGLGGYASGSHARFVELAAELWAQRDDREALSRRCREYVHLEHSAETVARQWRSVIDGVGSDGHRD